MNTWLKIKNKIYAEKLSEIDGLFSLTESNSSWGANLQSWASNQKFNKYKSLALSLGEYHEVNKNLTRINEELFHEFRNKEAVSSFKEEFKKYYKILLNQKENGLKLEVAAELIEENELSLEALSAWYLENKNLPEIEFKEAVGEFLGDVWKGTKRGAGYGALGGATVGGLSTGGMGALAGAGLGGAAGALGGAALGGGKHLLNRFLNWQKTRNTPASPASGDEGSSSSPNYSTLRSGRGGLRGSSGSDSSSNTETLPDYKNQTEFEKVKKEALAILQKLKQYSTNLETDTNFHHLLDTIIEKLGGDKAPTVPVPDKNFQAQVAPPVGGSSFDTGMQNTGSVSSFDTGSIHALPGAPPAATVSAATPKPSAAAPKPPAVSASAAAPKPPAVSASAAAPKPPAVSASAAAPKPPAAKPTDIPPKINDEKDVLDYLSIPDEAEMNKRLEKVGVWLHMINRHSNHDDVSDFKMLEKLLMSNKLNSENEADKEENIKYGESYKKHLIQKKLANKSVEEPAKNEPSTASTEPAVTSATTGAMPGAPPAAKKKESHDPNDLVNMPMKPFKKLLIRLKMTNNGKLAFSDKEIGKPGSVERKSFIIDNDIEADAKKLPTIESFSDKLKFYKEALRGF